MVIQSFIMMVHVKHKQVYKLKKNVWMAVKKKAIKQSCSDGILTQGDIHAILHHHLSSHCLTS